MTTIALCFSALEAKLLARHEGIVPRYLQSLADEIRFAGREVIARECYAELAHAPSLNRTSRLAWLRELCRVDFQTVQECGRLNS